LDDGAEEYAIRPPPEDTKVILKMLSSAETVSFDFANKVLITHQDLFPTRVCKG
jgi:hypothetical protein